MICCLAVQLIDHASSYNNETHAWKDKVGAKLLDLLKFISSLYLM